MLLQQVPYGVRNALFFLFLLYLLRAMLRNQWAALVAFAAIFTVLSSRGSIAEIAVGFAIQAVVALVLLRWGLLAGAVSYWVNNVMDVPITSHTSAWYQGYAVGVLMLLVAIAAWALHAATRGRRWVSGDLFA